MPIYGSVPLYDGRDTVSMMVIGIYAVQAQPHHSRAFPAQTGGGFQLTIDKLCLYISQS
jgi:hypothetical protein